MRTLLLFLILALPAFASVPESPIVSHKVNEEREFQNVYQAIKNPTISAETVSSATISSLTVSTMSASSATITNATINTSSITTLSVSVASVTVSLDLGSKKITHVANGTVSTDAATFSQVKLLQTVTGETSAGVTVASTNASSASLSSSNLIRYTPTVTTSTAVITIIVNVACDGMSAGSAIYVTPVIDGVTFTPMGIMQIAGFSGHVVWNQTLVVTKFFGDTNQHTIQIGGYKVGTVTGAVLSSDTAPGTRYLIQEELF